MYPFVLQLLMMTIKKIFLQTKI